MDSINLMKDMNFIDSIDAFLTLTRLLSDSFSKVLKVTIGFYYTLFGGFGREQPSVAFMK